MPTIEMHGICKRFDSTTALNGVDLVLRAGEIHALCGQNGSGKSTLVKILAGVHTPDEGSISLWGAKAPRHFRGSEHGIAVIHQNLALSDELTVLENFGVTAGFGAERTLGYISWKRARADFKQYAARFSFAPAVDALTSSLRPSDRALLAILRSIRDLEQAGGESANKLFILDEPTTYLPMDEKARLRNVIRTLAAEGIGVLLVSHDLDYVLDCADSVTVLRDGNLVSHSRSSRHSKSSIVDEMIGGALDRFYPDREPKTLGEEGLRVRGLQGERLDPLDLDVRAGEIVGLTGLAGGAHEEFPYELVKALRKSSGTVWLSADARASAAHLSSPVAVVPSERDAAGMWIDGTAAENVTIANLRSFVKWGTLRRRSETRRAEVVLGDYGVRPHQPTLSMHKFSGGNQQKIVLARWLSCGARVLILHEPVQGIDVAANAEIFEFITTAARDGAAIVICSNEWEHLVHLCDRVIAFRDRRAVAELSRSALDLRTIAAACQSRGAQPNPHFGGQ